MKKILLFLSFAVFLFSCGETSTSSEESSGSAETTETTESTESTESETDTEAPRVEFEEGKVYPFMELKEIYNQDWEGESKGNPVLDGKTTTITGEVFYKGQNSKLVGDNIEVTGARLEFRGGEFKDPVFGHDFECLFPPEMVDQVTSIEEGTPVTVKGVIDKQEIYIEPGQKYTVMTLKECELIEE